MRLSLEIPSGRSVRVRGPARIEVKGGECIIAGARLSSGAQVIVSSYKSQAIYTRSGANIEIEVGEGGGVDVAKPDEEPLLEWIEAAERISSKGSRIVVIGPVESGKTTFSTLVANMAIDKGLRPCIIDGDVGQEDIGPPGFVALACPTSQFVWLRDLEPISMRYVGYNNPSMGSSRLVASILDLAVKASSIGDLVIINTDGWVSSPQALEMKFDIARYVGSTHIVLLAGGLFAGHLPKRGLGEIVILRSPQGVRTRSREERRALRSQAYRKAFEGSSLRSIDMGSILVTGSCLLSGKPLSEGELSEISEALGLRALYGSSMEGIVYILVENGRESERPIKLRDGREAIIIPKGGEKGLLCSLVTRTGEEYPCIVDSIDPISMKINVVTRYQGEVSAIVIGRIRIDEGFEDSWRGSRCPI